ncbi:hypothetical protein KKY53_10840 [Pseudomonas aeruginosa]|nr:hypothetical protein KKY53_10840 [Pseudomonas aeruginosa]HBO0859737.1 hypothetical protein [Pseudomonas aeruginosa]HCE6879289.1 hypothetical protein [Pseudomonas aeruginosa]HDR2971095.1 hypothetical protein [Pseudomonas aeruginosa]
MGKVLLWIALLLAASVTANIAGILFIGSIQGWERWLADAAAYFLFWRLCLYAATAYGWRWMRRRLLARDASADTRRRLLRTEIASVAALLALECSLLLPGV